MEASEAGRGCYEFEGIGGDFQPPTRTMREVKQNQSGMVEVHIRMESYNFLHWQTFSIASHIPIIIIAIDVDLNVVGVSFVLVTEIFILHFVSSSLQSLAKHELCLHWLTVLNIIFWGIDNLKVIILLILAKTCSIDFLCKFKALALGSENILLLALINVIILFIDCKAGFGLGLDLRKLIGTEHVIQVHVIHVLDLLLPVLRISLLQIEGNSGQQALRVQIVHMEVLVIENNAHQLLKTGNSVDVPLQIKVLFKHLNDNNFISF